MKILEKHDWYWGKTINEDYFIQKPVEMEDLVKKLTSIMGYLKNNIYSIYLYYS